MYTEVLRHIDGIGLFPAVSLVLFVIAFTVVLFRVGRLDRTRASDLAHLPFDRDAHDLTDGAQR